MLLKIKELATVVAGSPFLVCDPEYCVTPPNFSYRRFFYLVHLYENGIFLRLTPKKSPSFLTDFWWSGWQSKVRTFLKEDLEFLLAAKARFD